MPLLFFAHRLNEVVHLVNFIFSGGGSHSRQACFWGIRWGFFCLCLLGVCGSCLCLLFGGGERVHSLAIWPCWWHWKHLPSFMYCLRSSSESFLKGKEAVASTSMALGSCALGWLCPVFWVGPELLAPGPIRMSLKCWVSILAVFCQSAMFLGMVSLIRQAWYKPRGSPFLKNSMFLGHLYLIRQSLPIFQR